MYYNYIIIILGKIWAYLLRTPENMTSMDILKDSLLQKISENLAIRTKINKEFMRLPLNSPWTFWLRIPDLNASLTIETMYRTFEKEKKLLVGRGLRLRSSRGLASNLKRTRTEVVSASVFVILSPTSIKKTSEIFFSFLK